MVEGWHLNLLVNDGIVKSMTTIAWNVWRRLWILCARGQRNSLAIWGTRLTEVYAVKCCDLSTCRGNKASEIKPQTFQPLFFHWRGQACPDSHRSTPDAHTAILSFSYTNTNGDHQMAWILLNAVSGITPEPDPKA